MSLRAWLHAVAWIGLCIAAAPARGESWPAPPVPPGAQVLSLGGEVVLNGRRSRMYRVEIPTARHEAMRYYRGRFGSRRVENRLGDAQIVATREGDYFHTVQLQDTKQGVSAEVVTTLLQVGNDLAPRDAIDEAVMPGQTVVLSTLRSDDGGNRSTLSVAANGHSMRANRNHAVDALQGHGFRIVSEDSGATGAHLILASGEEEVVLTVSDHGAYRSLVMNRIRRLQ